METNCELAKLIVITYYFHIAVGHKVDDGNNREVKKEEAQALANEYRMISYIETSSKADINVDEVSISFIREMQVFWNGGG